MTEKRPLRFEDFWALKTVGDVQVSPDGKAVAYAVGTHDETTNTIRSAIWVADIETGAARQFTAGDTSDTQPRWSADGQRLAFVSTRHEGKPHIFMMPVTGGEPRRLTSMKDGAHSPVWSPDGRRICFASAMASDRQKVPQETEWFEAHPEADGTVPRLRRQATLMSRFDGRGYIDHRTHLFVIDVDTGGAEPRQLTEGDYDNIEAVWSPDGELIAFMSNRTEHAEFNGVADVWTVAVDSGELRRLTNEDLTAYGPAWSPDGQSIAFMGRPESVAHGYADVHVWTVSRRGGDQRDVSAALDQAAGGPLPDYVLPPLAPPTWSPDSKTIYWIAKESGDGAIFAVDAGSGAVRRVSAGPCAFAGVQCTADGELLVGLASTPTVPYDVFAVSAAGGAIKPVVSTNHELLASVTIVPPERIEFEGPDGWTIEGWLIKPVEEDSAKPYPLILHVHGGPQGMFGNNFYFQKQALAGAGYASVFINPRGSTGYGQDFALAADWGEKDYLDIMAGVDAVLARGEVDETRLGVTGISYGGFMTDWIVGHTDRFSGAVSVNGVSDFFSFYGVSDIGARWFEHTFPGQFPGPFWASDESWQRYRFHSPISYVGNVTTPLLLIQSENDYRCPIDQGEAVLTALRMRQQTVALIRIPNATHVVFASGAPHHRYLQWKVLLDWFDTYVKRAKPESELAEPEEAGVTVEAVPVP